VDQALTILTFIGRRLGGGLILLFILSFLVFGLLAISPGSPIQILLGARQQSPALVTALTAEYHLNDPFIVQYWYWLAAAARLDFGTSISVQTGVPVASMIAQRMPVSLELSIYTLILVLLIGVPFGMLAGSRRGRATDRTVSALATFGISAPAFASSVVLLYIFGVALNWFPVYGVGNGFWQRLVHLTLPAVALAGFLSAIVIRQTRAATLTVMDQDYITFARIRGVGYGRILIRYALRNCSLPVVTSAGILLVAALSSGVFVEQVFSLPGAGSLLLTAVTNKDVPVVQGLAMMLGATVIVINLLVDLLALALDPRTRTSAGGG
jgi:peptide/nickel transport system permease protein